MKDRDPRLPAPRDCTARRRRRQTTSKQHTKKCTQLLRTHVTSENQQHLELLHIARQPSGAGRGGAWGVEGGRAERSGVRGVCTGTTTLRCAPPRTPHNVGQTTPHPHSHLCTHQAKCVHHVYTLPLACVHLINTDTHTNTHTHTHVRQPPWGSPPPPTGVVTCLIIILDSAYIKDSSA